ncbi:MAG: WD40 repeat domain-containing protein, partial [Bacteroidales bacterium]|nr:WD40 repeat domain-containing protein [Bacteroidales bacterium]
YLASGSRDKTVIVWDANSGAILQTMKGHSFGVNCVSWSPDGKYLASAAWDMSIVLWNPNNGKNLQTLKGHTFSVESLCWTPDGKYLISGAGDQTVRIWSEETEYNHRNLEPPVRKPARDIVTTESKSENGVETEQTQIEKPAKKIIKKSIEKTEEEILIKEYDQQGKLIKITEKACPDCKAREFNFKDGKIISATEFDGLCSLLSVNKQKNSVTYDCNSERVYEFNEFGIKKYSDSGFEEGVVYSYEYNKDGLLVKRVVTYEDYVEGTSNKTTTTYTYDVMSQDWKKRTGTDDQGNKTVTTRTVEYW